MVLFQSNILEVNEIFEQNDPGQHLHQMLKAFGLAWKVAKGYRKSIVATSGNLREIDDEIDFYRRQMIICRLQLDELINHH
jgi:hypothetical protein